ncbi:hypothetical protein F442_03288, partial [Phytophthora nicotianae P10297]
LTVFGAHLRTSEISRHFLAVGGRKFPRYCFCSRQFLTLISSLPRPLLVRRDGARGLRSSEDADVSEWRAFVEATFCQAIATKPRLSSGIACGASCCGQERGCWSAFGYPGPTRTSDSKLQKQQQADSALAEVMSQKEKVDNEGEPSDRNSNFGEQGDESAQEGEAMEDGSASSDTGEEQELASDRDLSSESEEGSSGEKSSHRKQTSQAARTATNTNRSEESDEEDGAFLEGFSRRSD